MNTMTRGTFKDISWLSYTKLHNRKLVIHVIALFSAQKTKFIVFILVLDYNILID